MISSGVYCDQIIGRSRELTFLTAWATDPAEHGRCMVIRGEAGLGKSRLVGEFVERMRAHGTTIGLGTAREYAAGPYAALAEALEPLRSDPFPVPDDARPDARPAWFAGVAQILGDIAAASQQGVIIILEDVHWADVATIELLLYSSSRLASAPIRFVATYRDEEVELDPVRARAVAALEHDANVIRLQPLPPGQIEHMIGAILRKLGREIPAEIIADIRELADGRPLYAEELLRGVLERAEHNGVAQISVPTSVRATVRERFLSLDESDREVLLHAAVLGQRFSAEHVARLANLTPASIFGPLRRARDLQIVVEDPTDDVGDSFRFRHALIREAVYGEMLRAEARLRHARVAEDLAERDASNVAAIAEHAWRAKRDENAAQWNERAGDAAYAVFAYSDAVRAFDRSFRCSEDPARRERVAERAAEVSNAMGDVAAAAEWCGEAIKSIDRRRHESRAVRLTLRRARLLVECGRFEEGLREAESVASSSASTPALRFEIETMIAGLMMHGGKAEEALARLRSLHAEETTLDESVTSHFLATYAYALTIAGHVKQARERFAQAIASAEAIGYDDMLVRTYNNWANLELWSGTISAALPLYDHARRVSEEKGLLRHTAWLSPNIGLAMMLGGDLVGADAMLARGEEIEHGLIFPRRFALALRHRLASVRGLDDAALTERTLQELDDASRRIESSVDLTALGVLTAALAYALGRSGRLDEAETLLSRTTNALEHDSPPFWLLDAIGRYGEAELRSLAHARLRTLAGREDAWGARGMLALFEARDLLRRRRRAEAVRHADLAVAELTRAGWSFEAAFAVEAAGRVPEALDRFRSIGATGEVRRLVEITPGERPRGGSPLSRREREVARMVVSGKTAREIAESLAISERTVETHLASAYRKFGVSGRAALAALIDGTGP